jgi:hypothetical protein
MYVTFVILVFTAPLVGAEITPNSKWQVVIELQAPEGLKNAHEKGPDDSLMYV